MKHLNTACVIDVVIFVQWYELLHFSLISTSIVQHSLQCIGKDRGQIFISTSVPVLWFKLFYRM